PERVPSESKPPDKSGNYKPHQINKCAVIGAGVMGGGIAQLLAAHGLPVRIKDLNYPLLATALKEAKKIYDDGVKRKKIKKNKMTSGMGLISPTITYSGFANADLVIEAVTEDMKIKKIVFSEVSKIVRQNTILASNTSCLSVQKMAESTNNPGKVIGMHFFNPVHRMPLIEVIRTKNTDDSTVATLVDFSRKLGKVVIVVNDSCGFLINRILLPYLTEAGFLLEEGVDMEKVDRIMTRFGMPVGPFALMDEIGIDVGYKVADILESVFGERMKVPSILSKIYREKLFGKKTGRGFFIYINKKSGKIPNKEIYNLLPPIKKQPVISQPVVSDKDILCRMVYRMVNEGCRCLEESVCQEPSDIEVGMIMGIGFPAFRAGLLHYADSIGMDKIVKELERFAGTAGTGSERFKPCNYLIKLAQQKQKFFN
ncbi:MAG: 3-hydroxyacyl-CoA dehydrogenase NAD-binding domain-containing protein, partial [Elusimicrobiota bacterium]|nr:3-hydroxyacyl-CoA dehydrogenase NAD-binding domain-containing protein [Elusimicrobiota bacterium]